MAQRSRTALKGFFETGDIPTQSNFEELIDSSPNFTDDDANKWTKYNILNDAYVPANNWVSYGTGGSEWSYTITHNLGTKDLLPSFRVTTDFPTNPEDTWDVITISQLQDYISFDYSPYTLTNILITTTTVTFIVSGSATKPEIQFFLRLLKV